MPSWVSVRDGAIDALGAGAAPAGAWDLGEQVLAPGFVDLQVNGVGDIDLAEASIEQFVVVADRLAAAGVTAWCPTIISHPLDRYPDFLRRVLEARGEVRRQGLPEILGAHLEGPFLGRAPGAHDPSMIRPADPGWLAGLLEAHPGAIRIVTLAPEADPHGAAIRLLAAAGITVALGHSQCSYADAIAAADAGATMVTHLFNAMSPLHHRDPGLVGAALDDDRLTPTLIADLVHVHPVPIRLALAQCAHLAVVSDAVASHPTLVFDDAVRLVDGTLAGASSLLNRALVNLVATGASLARAIDCVATTPARLVGEPGRGVLRVGARADLVELDPETLAVRSTRVASTERSGSQH